MENLGQNRTERLINQGLAQRSISQDIDAAMEIAARELVQTEAARQTDRRMARQYGIVLDISEVDPDHNRNVVNPSHGPHEQVPHPPVSLYHTPVDIPRVHDCSAGTGLTPMERFAAISTIDEPWPFYARKQMTAMRIQEGDPKTAIMRGKAAQMVAEANGQPIASSDALNECSRMESGTEPPSSTQKKQRLVRRSPSHGPRSSGG
ncbi:hypothetical protein LTR78_001462 [Recurvomyces mirabilis]|uniref:Uncharacterized protein n=1 Tax=Recurvomyces mirabilis TaxID=574656 RepID=A0AAE0WW92_9PEZI|nr:hypothetical protein LTR78_001462 [Recurvomyces mirabilis]KAK5161440.1 hypothetical protein LTS14_001236 [Recurvomyces mirabilis]